MKSTERELLKIKGGRGNEPLSLFPTVFFNGMSHMYVRHMDGIHTHTIQEGNIRILLWAKKIKMVVYFYHVSRACKAVVSVWVTISCYLYPARLPLHTKRLQPPPILELFRTFSSHQKTKHNKETLYQLIVIPLSSNLLSVTMDLPIVDISYYRNVWYVCGLLCQVPFT